MQFAGLLLNVLSVYIVCTESYTLRKAHQNGAGNNIHHEKSASPFLGKINSHNKIMKKKVSSFARTGKASRVNKRCCPCCENCPCPLCPCPCPCPHVQVLMDPCPDVCCMPCGGGCFPPLGPCPVCCCKF